MHRVNDKKKTSVSAWKREVRESKFFVFDCYVAPQQIFRLPYMAPEYVIISKYQAISMQYYDCMFALITGRAKCYKTISFNTLRTGDADLRF